MNPVVIGRPAVARAPQRCRRGKKGPRSSLKARPAEKVTCPRFAAGRACGGFFRRTRARTACSGRWNNWTPKERKRQRRPHMSRQTEASQLTLPVSAERDHIRGPSPIAPVTLVEYGDFECPHCGRAYDILEELLGQMGNDVRLVFRHFPLTQVHPHAQRAADAAEAAAAQGKFWELHDM